MSFTYAYDHSGNITKETSAAGDTSYTYDGNNQLIKEVLPGGTTNSYEYDAAGNRTSAKLNSKTNTYTYNDANQVVTKNGTAFKYDADGNLIQDDQYKYEYNALGAQTRVSKLDGTEAARYEYDENGLRTKKIIGDQTIEYAYDGDANNLVLEVTKKNNRIQTYRYFQWDDSGNPVGMAVKEKNGSGAWQTKPYYFWTNQRGDVTAIVDSSGAKVGAYTYDAFGNEQSETGDIAKSNPIRYAGYYYDTETKHDYLKARYYDPQNGNFLALDPHPGDDDDPVSQNGYTYAGNNPVMNVDPSGQYWRNHWWNSRWFVSNLINAAITVVTGKPVSLLSKFFKKQSKKKYLSHAARLHFSNKVKRRLIATGISYKLANRIVNVINASFQIWMWYSDPGKKIFSILDSRDHKRNNGYLNY
ncbi:RHS repeat-associated core domain-containing protein [Terrilactibacillus sp. S3-3]|nr:RHS repeat-associated core domain-containing protein [Terrilactibacillus sp. S3-3]